MPGLPPGGEVKRLLTARGHVQPLRGVATHTHFPSMCYHRLVVKGGGTNIHLKESERDACSHDKLLYIVVLCSSVINLLF